MKPHSVFSTFSSFFNHQEIYYDKNFNRNVNKKIPYLYNNIATIKHNSGPITEIALFTDFNENTKKTYAAAGCCVNQLDVQKDNFITSILEDGYAKVCSTHNEVSTYGAAEENYSTISDVKISNSGKYIYTSGFDKRIEVWDRKNFQCKHIIGQQHRANINRLAVHPEYYDKEVVASCSDDGVVILYCEKGEDEIESPNDDRNENDAWHQNKLGYPSSYSACDITFGIKNCNNLLFTGFECEYGGIVKMYDINENVIDYRKKFSGRISCISLSPTGNLLSCGTFIGSEEDYSGNAIYLIDTNSHQHKNINTPQNDINLILWSRDGQKIVSCSTDDCAIIYDIRYLSKPLFTLKHEGYLEPDSCGIVSAKWMNKADILITGGSDSSLRFWDLKRSEPEIHNIFLNDTSVSSISLTDGKEEKKCYFHI